MVQNAAEGEELKNVNAEHGCFHTELLITRNKNMTGPKENSEFLFPRHTNVSRGEAVGNIEVDGKQTSLFLAGPVIKCFIMPANSKLGKKTTRKSFAIRRVAHKFAVLSRSMT